jgi:hypothetical protein
MKIPLLSKLSFIGCVFFSFTNFQFCSNFPNNVYKSVNSKENSIKYDLMIFQYEKFLSKSVTELFSEKKNGKYVVESDFCTKTDLIYLLEIIAKHLVFFINGDKSLIDKIWAKAMVLPDGEVSIREFISSIVDQFKTKLLNQDSEILRLANAFGISNLQCNVMDKTFTSFLWIIYLIFFEKKVLIDDNVDELGLISVLPLKKGKIEKVFEDIRMYEFLIKNLKCETHTGNRFLRLEVQDCFLNKEMAYDIVNRKILFLKLLHENPGIKKKLESLFFEIKKSMDETSGLDMKSVEEYLHQFVPIDFFGGKNASSFIYAPLSLMSQWQSVIMQLGRVLFDSSYKKNEGGSWILNSNIARVFMPFRLTSATTSTRDTNSFSYGDILYQYKSKIDQNKVADFNKNFFKFDSLSSILLFPLKAFNYPFFKFSSIPETNAVAITAALTALDLFGLWGTGKNVKSLVKSIRSLLKYFGNLKKITSLSDEAYGLIEKLYKDNVISLESMVPEILLSRKAILDKSFIDKVKKWNLGLSGKIKLISGIVFPGFISKFYFNEVKGNESIERIEYFVGCLDATLTKVNTVLNEEAIANEFLASQKNNENNIKNSELEEASVKYSYPVLLDNNLPPTLIINDFWFLDESGDDRTISNSLALEDNKKNACIVSPVGAGKTTVLAALIMSLYLANTGIVNAELMKYTYFSSIMDYIKIEYRTGGGLSGYLSESKVLRIIERAINKNKKLGEKTIIFLDEVYSRTRAKDSLMLAKRDLHNFLNNDGAMCIFTTHHPELTGLANYNSSKLGIYYMEVLYDPLNKAFNRTFKMLPHSDDKNWWIEDENQDLRMKYYNYIDDTAI